MNQAAFDQDLSCRTIGRCVAGPPLDRELGDLVPRTSAGEPRPVSEDLGRAFLYARYDALLTAEGLARIGCGHIDPAAVSSLDSVEAMPQLREIGRAVAREQLRVGDFETLLT
jgi:hypothetical protein